MHAACAQRPSLSIVWQVENPFRFFLDPADTQVHRATWAQPVGGGAAPSRCMAAERVLGERHPDGWSAITFAKTCWDRSMQPLRLPRARRLSQPQEPHHPGAPGGLEDAQTVDCTWLTSPQGKRRPRGKAVTLPCDTPVQLDVPYPSGAWISVEIGGRQVAEAAARVTDLFIVGMGDSFASGEGNPDVPVRFSPDRTTDYGVGSNNAPLTGYPARIGDWKEIGDQKFIEENARWQDQACHRSLYSHQLRAALQLAVEDPHRAVTFVGFACSGAETTFGLFLEYKGNEWVPNPPDLPQISAVAEAQCGGTGARDYDLPEAYHINEQIPELKGGLVLKKCDADRARKIDLLFLSVGGNDVGFARLVANAVLADKSILRRLGGWFGQVHGFAEAGSPARCARRPAEIGQPRAAQPPARAVAGVRPHHPHRLSADGAARRRQDRLPRRPGRHDRAAGVRPERGQGARGQRGGRAPQRHHAGERAPAFVVVRGRAPRHLPRPRPVRRLQRCAPGPWPTSCACRARSTARWEPFNPSQWRAYAPAPAPVPHAQRRLHDGQFPCRPVADAEGAEHAGLRLGAAAAGQRLLGRLPSLRRRPGGDRRRRRRACPRACSPSTRAAPRATASASTSAPPTPDDR